MGKKMCCDSGMMVDQNEISFLEEELIQLSLKSSLVVPSENLTLLRFVWMRKTYNPDSLRAQLKSIWKTNKKFEILITGQNLFTISFEDQDDLEQIMKGRPWLFQKQLIIFDRLVQPIERNKIKLIYSPFWLKVWLCPPKYDKKDLMHAIGSTFRGVARAEIKGMFCRIRVNLDVQKQLRMGIFIAPNGQSRIWLPFKYENLPTFCFGCGRMGHGSKECSKIVGREENEDSENYPFSIALKAESSILGKESLLFGSLLKKSMKQCFYTGEEVENKDDARLTTVMGVVDRTMEEFSLEKTSVDEETKTP
ncbi:hypothetical protein GOBAR_AA15248 [Gossypium barbadense]|uniref:CCHC-type domain-containing protein n=1 Tax=Gossypium barbadense TaxID=3634 RepID=A0A2P5XQ11_GOSBA|nr:hypothetical protein GOBAR_AA15248 [Gossypium barbadense]